MRSGKMRLLWAGVASVLCVLSGGHAAGEPAGGVAGAGQGVSVDEHLQDLLVRASLTGLRVTQNPEREDFRLTALALRLARSLTGDDLELLRLEHESWKAAGDREAERMTAREILRVDPTDQMAQLRLALSGIDRLQDADARLEAYGRLLGSRGEALHSSVRSRLALDAALLARENGLEDRFLELLTLSTTLDLTNKDASALYAATLLPETESARDRVEILANVLAADPLDTSAVENLALELMEHGAFAGALEMYNLLASLLRADGKDLNAIQLFDIGLCLWNASGVNECVSFLNSLTASQQARIDAERKRMEEEGLDPGPETVAFLSPELEMMRLAIAVLGENREMSDRVLVFVEFHVKQERDRLSAFVEETPEIDEDDLAMIRRGIALRELWAWLFAGLRLEQAEASIEELFGAGAEDVESAEPGIVGSVSAEAVLGSADPATSSVAERRFRGWLALQRGEYPKARRMLSEVAGEDRTARWALAELERAVGNTRSAMGLYAQLASEEPRALLTTAAWHRLLELRRASGNEAPLVRFRAGREIDGYILQFVQYLRQTFLDPRKFMTLHVKHEDASVDVLQRMRLVVRVQLLANSPVAVGSNKVIPKRILLAPDVRVGGQQLLQVTAPMVAEIASRLRLDPYEVIEVTVTPSWSMMVGRLDGLAFAQSSVRWQATLGFQTTDDGGFEPQAFSLVTLSDMLHREGVGSPNESLAGRIESGEGREFLEALVLMQVAVSRSGWGRADADDDWDGGELRRIAEASVESLIGRIGSLGSREASISVLRLLGAGALRAEGVRERVGEAFAGHAARDAHAGLVYVFYLARDIDDPLLGELAASSNAEVRAVARIVQERFRRMSAGSAAP